MTVTVRFAPSPTGYLHIGGARTALYNWLYAKHTGGKFLLRIEDTDRARSTDEATQAILDGLKWLGLDWDGDAVSQFDRADRHRDVAARLLESGQAYRCYATAEELADFREKHPHEKYQSPWRDRTDGPEGQPYAIRIKAPRDGQITIDDQIQGSVSVSCEEIDDFIIIRSDGTPTYLHAVVVDDHDMGITHVMRGDDHFTNTFRHYVIFKAMGWDVPVYAHIPLIHGADGAKLSKRHGALAVDEYRKMGFLPEAMCNYLLRLGWAHGDEELISQDRAIEIFDFKGINKAPGRLDFKKMEAVNQHYIKIADNARLVDLVLEDVYDRHNLAEGAFLSDVQLVTDETARDRLLRGMDDLKSRAKTIVQLSDESAFYLHNDPVKHDDTSRDTLNSSHKALIELEKTLSDIDDEAFTADAIEAAIKALANDQFDGKLADVMKPLRAAICGKMSSPPLPKALEILGQRETLARIRTAIA